MHTKNFEMRAMSEGGLDLKGQQIWLRSGLDRPVDSLIVHLSNKWNICI